MKWQEDYLGRDQCNAVKGVFILLVFFSHFMGYVKNVGGAFVGMSLGQLIVAPFLFYSGYGVMVAIIQKGSGYVRDIPKRRILTTLLNFDVAVLVFMCLDFLLGRPISLEQILLSLVAWDSIGNSNWYICVVLIEYALTWGIFSLARKFNWGQILVIFAIVISFVLLMVVLSFLRESFWFDTMLCYPLGLLFARYHNSFECVARKRWLTIFVVLLVVFFVCGDRLPFTIRGLIHNVRAMAFALLIVLVTMRVSFHSRALVWCGQRLFPLYIYQRLPMLALYTIYPLGFANGLMPIYFVVCLGVSICLAWLYPWWQIGAARHR